MFLFFLLAGCAWATLSGPRIVYTLEHLDVGDARIRSVPDEYYLYPHIDTDDSEDGLFGVLKKLRSFKPELYEGIEIMKVEPEEFYPKKLITIKTMAKTDRDFKTIMAELIYSFGCYRFDFEDVPVAFHFKDSKLEKKYGGKKFTRKDVRFPIFLLKSALSNK